MLTLTPELLTYLAERVAEESSQNDADKAFMNEAGGMTLFGTIGASYHLRPDGSVWAYEWRPDSSGIDEWHWREVEIQEALGAIKVAAQRLPILRTLLPEQSGATIPCPECRGTGHLTRDELTIEGVWCSECYGLGFLVHGAT